VRGPTAHSRRRKRSPRPRSGSKAVPQLTAIGVDEAPDSANAKQQLATVGINHPAAIANAKHQLAGVGIHHPRATDSKENPSSVCINYAVPVIAFIAHDPSLEKTRSPRAPSRDRRRVFGTAMDLALVAVADECLRWHTGFVSWRIGTRALSGEIVGGVLDFGID
jgi:hypothetical protein